MTKVVLAGLAGEDLRVALAGLAGGEFMYRRATELAARVLAEDAAAGASATAYWMSPPVTIFARRMTSPTVGRWHNFGTITGPAYSQIWKATFFMLVGEQ